MRPRCESCEHDLPAEAGGAWICSFECTWCTNCRDGFPGHRCPNCGGVLTPRPPRDQHAG